MKFTWGMGIITAIIGFICFIMYMVVTMTTNEAYRHDLVTEEYYKKELDFQVRLDKEINAGKLTENITLKKTYKGVEIQFPKNMEFSGIQGKMFLYRPSNKQLDFELPLSMSSSQLLVPDNRLVGGRWNIEIDWTHQGQSYFYKKEFTY